MIFYVKPNKGLSYIYALEIDEKSKKPSLKREYEYDKKDSLTPFYSSNLDKNATVTKLTKSGGRDLNRDYGSRRLAFAVVLITFEKYVQVYESKEEGIFRASEIRLEMTRRVKTRDGEFDLNDQSYAHLRKGCTILYVNENSEIFELEFVGTSRTLTSSKIVQNKGEL